MGKQPIKKDVKYIEAKCKKVPESGCWIWSGSVGGQQGYGRISLIINGVTKYRYVHRHMYELTYGAIAEGACVCHKCDVPLCCNPNHLFVGTQYDNMQDKVKKGRQLKGSTHPNSDIDEDIARRILTSPLPKSEIASLYNVSYNIVDKIKEGLTWTHLKSTTVSSSNITHKLSHAEITQIRTMRKDGATLKELAAKFNVKHTTIWYWTHNE